MSKKKIFHSFLTVLLIYLKSTAIACSMIAPILLPDCYQISPWSSEAVMSNFLLASEDSNLNPPSKIAFTAPITYSVNETSKILLTEYPPD